VPEHIKGLIFDCDGTLVDSMPLHMDAWRHVIEAQGVPWDHEFFFSQKGRPEDDLVVEYNERVGSAMDPSDTVQMKHEYLHARLDRLEPIPRVVEIVHSYHGVLSMAVASGSTRRTVMLALGALGLVDYFSAIVTADDGIEPKPSPEIFIEAARRMHVPPRDCQVFEDGDLGLEAAIRAGMLATDVR